MKKGWEYKKLNNICFSIEDGDWIESKDQSPNGIRLIQTGNIGNGGYKDKQESAKYISEETFKRLHCTEIFEGDILVSRLPDPVGRACILPYLGCRCITAVDCSILKIKKDLVCDAWITYYMQSQAYFSIIKAQCTGSTRLRITRKKLAEILIPVPSLSEQQSIVDYLDSAFAKIDAMKANAEKALNEAKALFQASLKEMLEPKEGWEEKKIKEICETVTDFVAAGSFASLRENVVYNSEKDYAQLVRTTDLKSGFSKDGYVYVNEHAFKYLYRVNLDKECIILPNVGVNCGEVYYVTPSILPYNNNVLGPNAVLVRSNNYSNHFLSYLFLGKDFQNKLSDITSHMAQPKFNKTSLKEIVISVPPLSEQQSIVTTLDSLKSDRKSVV